MEDKNTYYAYIHNIYGLEEKLKEIIAGSGTTGSVSPNTFKALTDTPADYVAQKNKLLRINAAVNAVEYTDSINAGSF